MKTTPQFNLMLAAALAALACAAALLATSPGLPMAWDEGNAIHRAEGIAHWAGRWLPDENGKEIPPGPLSRQAIAEDWRYTTQVEGHPAFYGVLIALGRWVSRGWLSPLGSARFGPILWFALAAGAMHYRLRRDYSAAAAWGAVGALLCMPRVFAHAHFASFDGPLMSCWIMCWAAFASAVKGFQISDLKSQISDLRSQISDFKSETNESSSPRAASRGFLRRWFPTLLWGILLGLTLSSKITGWCILIPFIAWAVVYRDRAAAKVLAVGVPAGLAVFFLFNPPLWHAPIEGLATFFRLNLHRAANPDLNISTLFLGQMYNLDVSLPWYNTLFWTAVTVPVGILLLAIAGLVHVARRWRRERLGLLLAALWIVLLVVRALPGAPPHDGVRLFLPAFAMLAALAGIGCHAVMGKGFQISDFRFQMSNVRLWIKGPSRWCCVVLLYAGSASSLYWYAPQWLSYYNLLLGGLRGAAACGMEPTYYWDGLDRSLLEWLNEHTPADAKICFLSGANEDLELLQQWGVLRHEFRPEAPGQYAWCVLQNRPGAWLPDERSLASDGRPAFCKVIRPGGWGPWRLDVPIVWVYRYQPRPAPYKICRERPPCRSVADRAAGTPQQRVPYRDSSQR